VLSEQWRDRVDPPLPAVDCKTLKNLLARGEYREGILPVLPFKTYRQRWMCKLQSVTYTCKLHHVTYTSPVTSYNVRGRR